MSLNKQLDDFRDMMKRHPAPWETAGNMVLDAKGTSVACVYLWQRGTDNHIHDAHAICAAVNGFAALAGDLGVGSLPPDSETEGSDL